MSNLMRSKKRATGKNSASRNVLIAGSIVLMFGAWAVAQTGGGIYFFMGAPALSTSNLSIDGGMMFELRFDVDTFEGDIIARVVSTDGSFTPDTVDENGDITAIYAVWQGRNTITEQSAREGRPDARIIITSDADGGRRFWWDNTGGALLALTNTMKAEISSTSPSAGSDPTVDWTRGYSNNEGTLGAGFRERTTVMGNPVHGSAEYLGPPSGLYGNGHSTFISDNKERDPLVFVGAGDAMLHAFKASDGKEVFAYIPSELLDDLEPLTSPDHSETFLVDGTPVTGDAYGPFPQCTAEKCWRTVLVSGLGFGGNTVFALDVTNPVDDTIDEMEAAAKLFLWEYTETDLGHTTSEPLIGQLNDGTWAAIFGSGEGAGKGILYVVNLATGVLIQKLEIAGSYTGLSSPAGRVGGDNKLDAVYAGDFSGNLWKFDFTDSKDLTGDIDVAYKDGSTPKSLITVSDPPEDGGNLLHISTRPVVTPNPNGAGVIVYFGTGSVTQNLTDGNGMFGVVDSGSSLGTNPSLDVHLLAPIRADGTVIEDPENIIASDLNFIYRIVVQTTEGDDAKGWKVQLMDGERVLTNPRLGNGRVSFTSSDAATTDFNRNWFLSVDFLTGGAPSEPFLDINGDGVFDSDTTNNIDDDVFFDVAEECTPNANPELPPECPTETFDAIPVGRFLDTGVVSAPLPANIANKRDTVFITHGLESVFDVNATPGLEVLLDPGVTYGHFDHDTHIEVVSGPGGRRDHTHEYDDRYDLNGVNMLVGGGNYFGSPATRPHTFTCGIEGVDNEAGCIQWVSGMLSADKALMDSIVLRNGPPDGVNTMVQLSFLNAHSWDTPQLAYHRCTVYAEYIGLDSTACDDLLTDTAADLSPVGIPSEITAVAPPVTIWYQCLNYDRPEDYNGVPADFGYDAGVLIKDEYIGPATGFNEGPCKARHIGILVSKVTNINALRIRDAGRDDCDYDIDNLPEEVKMRFYPDSLSGPYQNSGYRGGSFTVRAVISGTEDVFHEDTIYEHANGGSIDRDRSAQSDVRDILETPGQGIGNCDVFSEWQRAYKDPDYFDGGGANTVEETDGDPVENDSTSGTQITETIDVNSFELPEGRVSWREMLK